MAIYKPQTPLKIGENQFYPLTTSDQIIIPNGERLDSGIISIYTINSNTLTGEGENGKFMANSSEIFSSFSIDNVNYNVRNGSENEIELISGNWYFFILDKNNQTINFNSGGGLSNNKLELATAVITDVVAGKTFYAGNKELKVGTRNRSQGKYGTFTSLQNEDYTVDLGFQPSKIVLIYKLGGSTNTTILFDSDNSEKYKVWSGNYSGAELNNTTISAYGYITLTSTGFKFRGYYTSSGNQNIIYLAIF